MTATVKGVEYGWPLDFETWDVQMNDNLRRLAAYAVTAWAWNTDAIAGLTYAYTGGVGFDAAGAPSVVAGGTVALANNATNYVERTIAGVVSANAAGWTAGRVPMAQVTTAGGVITAHTDLRGSFPGAAGGGGGGGSTTLPASDQLIFEYRANHASAWLKDAATGKTAIVRDEWNWALHAGADLAGDYVADVGNGKPGLYLPDSGAGYDTGIAIGAPYTIVVVFRVHSTGLSGNHRVIQGKTANFLVGPYGGAIRHFSNPGFVDAGKLAAAANTTYTCVVTNSGTASTFRVNGVDRTATGTLVTSPQRLVLGSTGAFNEPAASYLQHLAAYVGVLPLATMQTIESQMATTWGP